MFSVRFLSLVSLILLFLVGGLPLAASADTSARIPNSQLERVKRGAQRVIVSVAGERVKLRKFDFQRDVKLTRIGNNSRDSSVLSTSHLKVYQQPSSDRLFVLIYNARSNQFKGFRENNNGALENLSGRKRFELEVPPASNEQACAAHELLRPRSLEQLSDGSSGTGKTGEAAGAVLEAELALVLDSRFFNQVHGGSETAATDEALSVVSAVDVIYSRDVETQISLVELLVITDPVADPTSSSDPGTALEDFSGWKATGISTQHDLAHLFSGIDLTGSTVGIAWLGSVCLSYYNSGVNQRFTSNFTSLTVLLAHEMGHNFDADHDTNPGIMYPSVTSDDFFSSRSIGEITNYISSGAGQCVEELSSAVCGNGVLEAGEECDGGDFGGASCGDVLCGAGSLTCLNCTISYESCEDCPVCDNDGVCELEENCVGCPSDCVSGSGAACGNGVCETADGEDCISCPNDCNGKQNGKPSGRFCCGDGAGENPVNCGDQRCSAQGRSCSSIASDPYCCGDLTCTGLEDPNSCAIDCAPVCGDGLCDKFESSCSCALDCGAAPAEVCGDGIDNDCDLEVDCEDIDCSSDPLCDDPSCSPAGSACIDDSECCGNKCRGPNGGRTCR